MSHPADFESSITRSIHSSVEVKTLLLHQPQVLAQIAEVCQLLIDAFRRGNKLFLFGNGGSAADAQHIAAEFVGRFAFNRSPLPALALNANSSSVTAIANDSGFEHVFARQLAALACRGDVAIAISTSARSPNVVHAISAAKAMGLHTVALTGAEPNALNVADYRISVPSTETPRIQECHILIGHVITELVEQTIFPDEYNSSPAAKH